VIDPVPFGDRAFRLLFPNATDAASWAEAARDASLPGIVDVVAAYETVAVHVDPVITPFEEIVARLRAIEVPEFRSRSGRTVDVPTCYDGEDLPEVAIQLGLTVGQVVREHSGALYRVMAIGFRPGFPYLEELSEPLRGLHRRDRPRAVVPEGSVAIVGRQTAIYPERSPGGWHLIGQTPRNLVDLKAGWFAFRVGDLVRFRPIDREEFGRILGRERRDAFHGPER
jgi:KipI family sensor histidine kinase inhibitor